MSDHSSSSRGASRRGFLKAAGALAATTAATSVGCAPGEPRPSANARVLGFERCTLDALAEVVLPSTLGPTGRKDAVDAFVAWVDGYEPVAEEMHGYGYADIRYLPADPAPGWRAQLAALDLIATRRHGKSLAQLEPAPRRDVVAAALAAVPGTGLPNPLGAPHVAVALMAHWADSPGAQDLALGVQVGTNTCRQLADVTRKPLPVAEVTA